MKAAENILSGIWERKQEMDDKKIAVLIDAENVSGKYIKLILGQ